MSESKFVEMSGESIEEAIQKGLSDLEATRTDVAIEIIEEGSMGVLGIGKKDAVVRLTLLDNGTTMVESIDVAPIVVDEDEEDALDVPVPVIDGGVVDSAEIDINPELEREAEIALDIVKNLVDKMGFDATVRADIAEKDEFDQRIVIVNIDGGGVESLIGEKGDTLNKLQFIARSMASQRINDKTSFVINIDHYRETRQAELEVIAEDAAKKVAEHNRPIALAPMPPHERRIIHMTLRSDKRVATESKGDGDRRRVRVIPIGMKGRSSSNQRDDRKYRGGNRNRNRRN